MSAPTPSSAATPSAPAWGAQPPAAPLTNGLAIAALVLGILGFALLPVILGHVALRQTRARGEAGTGVAIVGLVLGYLALAVYAVLGILLVVGLVGGLVWWS